MDASPNGTSMKSRLEDPDLLLVRAAQNDRDGRSFARLVEQYQREVYGYCCRFLGNKDDAADCTQEIFIRVFRHLKKFSFKSKFSTWLYRIMVNCCIDMAKKRETQMHPREDPYLEHTAEEAGRTSPLPLSTDRENPEKRVIRKEVEEAFSNALMQLNPNQRMVVVMRDVEGRSYEEVATITGMNPGTVRSALARGRQQMALQLKDYRYEL